MWKSLAGLILAGAAFAQTPAQTPPALQFEVASIRPAGAIATQAMAGKLHVGMNIDAARVDIGSMSLVDLIRTAYKVKAYQITGPDWMKSQRFDILAKMPEGATKDQVPEMLQALLTERFKLEIHRDHKEQSVYALVVGKGGAKLKESPADADAPAAAADSGDSKPAVIVNGGSVSVSRQGQGAVVRGGPMGTTRVSMGPNGAMHMEADKMTMAGFAEMLSRFMDRPVVDLTDLTGTYQVGVDLSMDDLKNAARSAGVAIPAGGAAEPSKSPGDAASDPSGGSIFSAVQQLGLKLDARKLAVEMIVVDHAEKAPTEN